MRVALVTNTDGGKGLQRDAELLGDQLRAHGHTVTPLHFIKAKTPPPGAFDLAIFLETAPPRFFDCAPVRWLIPNPEWWEPGDSIEPFARVLCKTADAERIFRQRADAADRVRFLGFESAFRGMGAIGQRMEILHVGGGSSMKGTQTILDAWAHHGIAHPLTVVTALPGLRIPKLPNVTVLTGHIPDARLSALQRAIPVHLQPSEYEGFGHCIHEGLSVGACVVTTDAEPMRSVDGVADLIRPCESYPIKSARAWRVSPAAIAEAVERVSARPPEWFERVRDDAIDAFQAQRVAFRERLAAFVAEVGT